MPQTSPFDPLTRMGPGEDRFVVREKDPVGPGTITEWARLRRNHAFKLFGTSPTGEAKRLLDAELAQCGEAEEKALEWSEKQAGGGSVDGEKATYNEVRLTEEQIAAAKRQKVHAELVRHLREADFLAHELLGLDGPAVTAALGDQAATIHNLADEIEYGRKAEAA